MFPSPYDPRKPMSDMSLTAVLKKMGRGDVTAHGFRSTFRDWAGETTAFPREVIEAAPAHRLKDKAEGAYARGDLFNKRRELMHAWAAYAAVCPIRCVRGAPDCGGAVNWICAVCCDPRNFCPSTYAAAPQNVALRPHPRFRHPIHRRAQTRRRNTQVP